MIQLWPTNEMPRRSVNCPERGNEGSTSMRSQSTSTRPCSVPNCDRFHYARGYCKRHYGLWHRGSATPDMPPPISAPRFAQTNEDRFMKYVDKTASGCWEWTGARLRGGYAAFGAGGSKKNGGRRYLGHRWSYEHWVGPIPEGLHIDHLCRNTRCVNPEHLEAVTPRENVMRSENLVALNARKTHCIRGHPFSGDNLLVRKGKRICKTCYQNRSAASNARRRREQGGEMAARIEHAHLAIEVKSRKQMPVFLVDAMAQAKASIRGNQTPVVVIHQHGNRYDDAMVVMRLNDFVDWHGPEEGDAA